MKNYLAILTFLLSLLFIPFLGFTQDQTDGKHSDQPAKTNNGYAAEFLPNRSPDPFPVNEPVEEEHHESAFQEKFFNMLFILAVLIIFMIFAAWLLKKMMRTRISAFNSSSRIKILETRNLSPRSTLYLIDIEGKSFLISETASAVTHLATLTPNRNE